MRHVVRASAQPFGASDDPHARAAQLRCPQRGRSSRLVAALRRE